jgi:hypothetical protein
MSDDKVEPKRYTLAEFRQSAMSVAVSRPRSAPVSIDEIIEEAKKIELYLLAGATEVLN